MYTSTSHFITHIDRKKVFWILVSLLCFMVLVYGYFVQATIHSIILRKNAERSIEDLTAIVSTLEFQYSTRVNEITKEFAYSLGFEERDAQTYTERKRLVSNQ